MRSGIFAALLAATGWATSAATAPITYELAPFAFNLNFSIPALAPSGAYEVSGSVKTDGTLTDLATPTLTPDNFLFIQLTVTNTDLNQVIFDQDYDSTDQSEDTVFTQLGASILATETELTLVFDPNDGIDGAFTASDNGLTIGFLEGSVNGYIGTALGPLVMVPLTPENEFTIAGAPVPVPPILPAMVVGLSGFALWRRRVCQREA